MNTATENLENDHVFILRLTNVMLAMVERKCVDSGHFELVVNLIRKFADGLHHAKEEEILFPKLGEKGFSPEAGPVAVMLSEHVQGREFVKGIVAGIEAFQKNSDGALLSIYENLTGYANLLQNHIGKENSILFRMADQVLSIDEQKELLAQFAQVENNTHPDFNHENSISKINNLAALYLQ